MGTTGFTIIDLIILIVYLLAVVVAGIYFCHNAQSDFLLGTRW